MAVAASPRRPSAAGAKILSNLAALSLALVAGGLALAYGIDILSQRAPVVASLEDRGSAIVQNLGGRVLTIPVSWLRYGVGTGEGFASQVDLEVPLTLSAGERPETVTVTLLPRSRARSSAALLDGVYLHQFGNSADTSVAGLIGKPLQGSGGFAGETVWYDPLSADPFAAKCLQPITSRGEARCLRTVILPSGIAATYEFGAGLLPQWEGFDAAVAPWLSRIGAL